MVTCQVFATPVCFVAPPIMYLCLPRHSRVVQLKFKSHDLEYIRFEDQLVWFHRLTRLAARQSRRRSSSCLCALSVIVPWFDWAWSCGSSVVHLYCLINIHWPDLGGNGEMEKMEVWWATASHEGQGSGLMFSARRLPALLLDFTDSGSLYTSAKLGSLFLVATGWF